MIDCKIKIINAILYNEKKKKKTVFFTAETIKLNPKDIKSNIPEKTQLG